MLLLAPPVGADPCWGFPGPSRAWMRAPSPHGEPTPALSGVGSRRVPESPNKDLLREARENSAKAAVVDQARWLEQDTTSPVMYPE